MNDHTLAVLDFDETLSRLAEFAQSEPGRSLALEVRPHRSEAEVLCECGVTAEGLRLLEGKGPDLGEVTDVAPALERLAVQGAVLEPLELLALALNQSAVKNARDALRDSGEELPQLMSLVEGMCPFPEWTNWVRRSITDKGEILDSASPELAAARRELTARRNSVLRKLEDFMKRSSVAKVMQEQFVTLRNGRYVVPARPEYHRSFEGVVQDSSQSGQTVFVEPLFAVEMNNSFTVAAAREKEEERRVLGRMTAQAAQHREAMAVNLGLLARLDLILAKGRFGNRLGGVMPVLDTRETMITQARHPLLVLEPGHRCVPIDIGIGGPTTTLVITGPNTGGKTVALKTLGLLTTMVQSGMPVPVSDESRFRVFEKIFADVGDEQSLAQSLSTFSGHMKIIARLLVDSDGATLVLLDELGAGTDPQEGSALGIALLEELNRRGACAVVTTHHNLLKEFAYRAPFARNASTVFDDETLEPTYRLRMGAPGRSHALDVAGRLGLGPDIVSRARELMGTAAVQVDELLGRLSEEVDRESTARERAEELAQRLEAQRRDLEEKRARMVQDEQAMRNSVRLEARALLRDIERKGKEILRGLRKSGERAQPALKKSVREMEEKVLERFPEPPPRRGGGPVAPGQEVEVLSLGVRGSVSKLVAGGDEAEVLSGGVRMRVPVTSLSPLRGEAAPSDRRPGGTAVGYEGSRDVPYEVNLIGTTVEEALQSLDRILDRSLLGPDRSLRIVHGKGTGALKRAISAALKEDPRVSGFGPAPLEQGGAGVTIVELKD